MRMGALRAVLPTGLAGWTVRAPQHGGVAAAAVVLYGTAVPAKATWKKSTAPVTEAIAPAERPKKAKMT